LAPIDRIEVVRQMSDLQAKERWSNQLAQARNKLIQQTAENIKKAGS